MVYSDEPRSRLNARALASGRGLDERLPQDVDRRGAATATIMTTGAHGVGTLRSTVAMVNEISAGAMRAMRSDGAAVIA